MTVGQRKYLRALVAGSLALGGIAVGSGALDSATASAAGSAATPVSLYVAVGGTGDCTTQANACGLIQTAIAKAENASVHGADTTINVAAGTYAEIEDVVDSPSYPITIAGAGATTTFVNGNQAGPVFSTLGGAVTITGLTIENGNGGTVNGGIGGGGIYNNNSDTTVTNSVISGNAGEGGGIYNEAGNVTIDHTTISNNNANSNASAAGGGVNNGVGTMTIEDSTISGNTTPNTGGGVFNEETMTIVSSTISDNVAAEGGGVDSFGPLTIADSTIAGNSATSYPGGGISASGTPYIEDSTITGNSAIYGGGVVVGFGAMTMAADIVAKNTVSNSYPDCYHYPGSITDAGYNIDDAGNCNLSTTNNSVSDSSVIDDYLGALGSYGGPTETVPLLRTPSPTTSSGDPATGAIPATFSLPVAVNGVTSACSVPDQRGIARSAPCAIGAYQEAGCHGQDITDGSYQIAGCFTDGSSGDTTKKLSSIDGVDVSANGSDTVDYTSSDSVTSSGISTVSLVLGTQKIPIFKGTLADSLTGPLTFSVASNTRIAGMKLSGNLTLTPAIPGVASGSVTVTLPPVLGSGRGTLSFVTDTNGGISSLSISVPKANFMHLFALKNLGLTFTEPGTWAISGTATSGGSTSSQFSGTMSYTGDTLGSASLNIAGISVAGLFQVDSLAVSYASGAWDGSAVIAQGSGKTVSAAVALTFDASGTLTSASIDESGPMSLFGVLDLDSFDMTYSGTSWGLAWKTTPSGSSGSASLTTASGVVSAANLTISNVSFAGKVTVDTATVSYSQQAPNPACPDVVGTEVWCGTWQVTLPQATIVTGVSGALAFANGAFAQASVTVSGNVPLLLGVALTQLTGSITVNPPPTTLSGGATIILGPPIGSVALFSLDGTLTRIFPSGTTGGEYDVGGTLTALAGSLHALVLGSGKVTVPDTGATTFDLTLGSSPTTGISFSVGGATVTVTGSLSGSFTATTFSMTGQSQVTTPVGTVSGTVKADNLGIAACGGALGAKVGFEYVWSTGSVHVFDTKGCSEKGF